MSQSSYPHGIICLAADQCRVFSELTGLQPEDLANHSAESVAEALAILEEGAAHGEALTLDAAVRLLPLLHEFDTVGVVLDSMTNGGIYLPHEVRIASRANLLAALEAELPHSA